MNNLSSISPSSFFKKRFKLFFSLALALALSFPAFAGVEPQAVLRIQNQSSATASFDKKSGDYDFLFTVPHNTSRYFAFYEIGDFSTVNLRFPPSKAALNVQLSNSNSGLNSDNSINQYCLVIDKNRALTSPKNCPIQIYDDGSGASPLLPFSLHIENQYAQPVRIEVQQSQDSRLAMTVPGRRPTDQTNPAVTVESSASESISKFLIKAYSLVQPYALDLSAMTGTDYAELVFYLPLKKEGSLSTPNPSPQPYTLDIDPSKEASYVTLKPSNWPLEEETQQLRIDQYYLQVRVSRWGITSQSDGDSPSFIGYAYNVNLTQVTQSQFDDARNGEDPMDVDTDPEFND